MVVFQKNVYLAPLVVLGMQFFQAEEFCPSRSTVTTLDCFGHFVQVCMKPV